MKGIHVVTGPMYAGKSTELMNRISRLELAGRKVWCLKPAIDARSEGISSHDGAFRTALSIHDAKSIDELREMLPDLEVDAFAFDEVQFMPIELVGFAQELASDYQVICAGLDLDAFGQPFDVTAQLMALAETIDKRKAVCTVEGCGNDASRTQRFTEDHVPITWGERIVVGGKDVYDAACIECFVTAPRK